MDPSITATQKSRDASPSQSRNMLTPHLQSTNVKIALQKEKSKRMIQILQQGSKRSLDSKREKQSHSPLQKKGSSPFLNAKKLDLGLKLEADLQVQALAGQELRTTKDASKVSKDKSSGVDQSLQKDQILTVAKNNDEFGV